MPAIDESMTTPDRIRLSDLRKKLAEKGGPEYWRSLEHLAESEDFEEWLRAEFPREAAALPTDADPIARRDFLKFMGASLVFAGLAGCTRQPAEKIVPAVRAPEDVPGKPLHFATAMSLGGYATGLLVESHEGRPTKIEGNPEHPASLGATDVFGQAAILNLYDPDRAQMIRRVNEVASWDRLVNSLSTLTKAQMATEGEGIRLVTPTLTSPTMIATLAEVKSRFPRAQFHEWEPVNRDTARFGSKLAYGESLDVVYHPGRTDVIVSLDSDFLAEGPDRLRYIREFAARRRPSTEQGEEFRLYIAESIFSITGSVADERLPIKASSVERLARSLARRLGVSVDSAELDPKEDAWIEAVFEDLAKHRGRSLVMAGDGQPAEVHALALAMNEALGNVGRTLELIAPVAPASASQTDSLRALTADMRDGKVDLLLLLDVNPVYDAPVDLEFAAALRRVPHSFSLGLFDDETSRLCQWHVPATHFLETWGDTRAADGTATITQPLIAPLYSGKSSLELLGVLLGRPKVSSHDLVKKYWEERWGTSGFEARWQKALHDGVIPETRESPRRPALQGDLGARLGKAKARSTEPEVTFRAHPTIGDGRFANNGWLQECPAPLTKLTWDNAVLTAPATAERLGVFNGEVVEMSLGPNTIAGPIWILPGQPEDSFGLQLGYGRTHCGSVGNGRGFDVYRLRTSHQPGFAQGVTVESIGRNQKLACTQNHGTLEGRHVVRSATLDEFREDPAFAQHVGHEPTAADSLYPEVEYKGNAWGMSIDLNACVGCNACIVACQSENNIPVVGPEQIAMGREMQWIRLDRYWEGELDAPEAHHQPMLCQHCERAPCEVVCPVNATVHDSEGLNLMVYNRCVGTRYCSNNCPYKVRRFNFYLYTDWETESLKLQRNPDVTVRSRGVMEKCTYCIQRINEKRNQARRDGRDLADGEIVTACQQVCPADAITFGDINDPESEVSRRKSDPRNYSVLGELNTAPRTTYLASVRNPNPDLHEDDEDSGGHA